MPRDYRVSLEDMLTATTRVHELTSSLSYDEFTKDRTKQEAVVRNLEIIGEAAKNVPREVRANNPEIDWAKLGGLRDVLIHQYFAVDLEVIWDIILTKLPGLDVELRKMLAEQF